MRRGSDDEDKIKEELEIAKTEIENSTVEGFHDKILVNDDLEATYESLEKYIFGDDTAEGASERENSPSSGMEDGAADGLATDPSVEVPTEMET